MPVLDLLELCITSAGKNHSVGETAHWLEESEFSNIESCTKNMFDESNFLRGYQI